MLVIPVGAQGPSLRCIALMVKDAEHGSLCFFAVLFGNTFLHVFCSSSGCLSSYGWVLSHLYIFRVLVLVGYGL